MRMPKNYSANTVSAKAFAKSHQPAGRASGPCRNFRPLNAPKFSPTKQAAGLYACPPTIRRRPPSHPAIRSRENAPTPTREGRKPLKIFLQRLAKERILKNMPFIFRAYRFQQFANRRNPRAGNAVKNNTQP